MLVDAIYCHNRLVLIMCDRVRYNMRAMSSFDCNGALVSS